MTGALYDVELQAGGRHALALVFPFSTPMDREAEAAVCALRYDEKAAEVVSYWRAHLQACASLSVPEAALAGMARAAIVHVAIGARTGRESGLTVLPAATWGYAACGNEASWQVELLDRVGRHDRAERYLTTFLKTQGQGRPEGRFTSPRGSFQARNVEGADGDGNPILGKGFGYNLDHGAIMAALANHYWLTGDRDWLARVSPHLVEACEFVTRERRQTMVLRDGQPAMEWGLLPAGRLEDNREWAHWFAVNAHAYRGMAALADVLAEIEHPQASALQVGAEEYRQDIRRAVHRATESSPVVRLRDGTFIPHVPSRTGLLGRDLGWFREAAYGALQLLECGVIAGNEPEATWILQDLEDNVFPSREWGRVVDLEEYWFSRSGMTIQPFLTSLGIDYLRRGQVKHGLRALFNSIAASLYDDVPVFAEHAVTQLGVGQGPFYKAPDECRAVLWLLTFLVDDEGDTLWLAPGAPRAWYVPGSRFGVDGVVTKYGPVTYHVACASTSTQVSVRCPERHRPQDMRMRLRLPGGALVRNVLVNGHRHDDYSPAEEYIRIPTREAHVHVTVEHDPIA